jgi:formylglycine-generating enzyme
MKYFLKLSLVLSVFISTARSQPKAISAMIFVKGGSFNMGSNDGNDPEKPMHKVTLSSFSIGKYEVTVAEYQAFCNATGHTMPAAPSWGWHDPHPMVNVSYDDAIAYCKWLSSTTNKNYRLPTEAEWEYAARGGDKSRGYIYSDSNNLSKVGWYQDNSGGLVNFVGTKKPNELGIYDMSGNVWEWCSDWYDTAYYSTSPADNPKGPSSGEYRVLRGGSYASEAKYCSVVFRTAHPAATLTSDVGFRVVCTE